MPYTVEDFMRDVTLEHLRLLPPEERLKGLPAAERLRGLSNEEIEEYLRKRRGERAPDRRGQ